jgi:sarcosine oxidase gamma subunit
MAASTLSGQFSPLEELTVTTSPSRIKRAAAAGETTLFMMNPGSWC